MLYTFGFIYFYISLTIPEADPFNIYSKIKSLSFIERILILCVHMSVYIHMHTLKK